MKRPNTCTNLIRAIKAVAADADAVRLSRQLANVIVGQMLPDGVIKGGSSLMFRYGSKFTRYTRDVDTARSLCMPLRQLRLRRTENCMIVSPSSICFAEDDCASGDLQKRKSRR